MRAGREGHDGSSRVVTKVGITPCGGTLGIELQHDSRGRWPSGKTAGSIARTKVIKTIFSIVASLFPERYRYGWFSDAEVSVKRGAIMSGWLEIVVAGMVLWLRYPAFLHSREQMMIDQVRAQGGADHLREGFATFAVGPMAMFEYMVLPLSLLLLYLAAEGCVRLMAAAATGEVLPNAMLALLSGLHRLAGAQVVEIKMGARVSDAVAPGTSTEFDLRIDSCRPKRWTKITTIGYNDELYEVAKEFTGMPPRPYIYLLKRMPGGKVVRGIYHYDPNEALSKEEK